MPDEPIAPPTVDDELAAAELAAEVATQPEDDDPLALADGDAADAPADSGRSEGVGP